MWCRSGRDRGFFSLDFILALTVILTTFSSVFMIYQNWKGLARGLGAQVGARAVCQKLATAVNMVYSNHPRENENFLLRFFLPPTLSGMDYEVSFSDNRIWVSGEFGSVCVLVCYDNVLVQIDNYLKPVVAKWTAGRVEVRNE